MKVRPQGVFWRLVLHTLGLSLECYGTLLLKPCSQARVVSLLYEGELMFGHLFPS